MCWEKKGREKEQHYLRWCEYECDCWILTFSQGRNWILKLSETRGGYNSTHTTGILNGAVRPHHQRRGLKQIQNGHVGKHKMASL